jgi:hypothetical protein
MEYILQLVWTLFTIASYLSILYLLIAGISVVTFFLCAMIKAFEPQPWER